MHTRYPDSFVYNLREQHLLFFFYHYVYNCQSEDKLWGLDLSTMWILGIKLILISLAASFN